jgi:hypothetical protein
MTVFKVGESVWDEIVTVHSDRYEALTEGEQEAVLKGFMGWCVERWEELVDEGGDGLPAEMLKAKMEVVRGLDNWIEKKFKELGYVRSVILYIIIPSGKYSPKEFQAVAADIQEAVGRDYNVLMDVAEGIDYPRMEVIAIEEPPTVDEVWKIVRNKLGAKVR